LRNRRGGSYKLSNKHLVAGKEWDVGTPPNPVIRGEAEAPGKEREPLILFARCKEKEEKLNSSSARGRAREGGEEGRFSLSNPHGQRRRRGKRQK